MLRSNSGDALSKPPQSLAQQLQAADPSVRFQHEAAISSTCETFCIRRAPSGSLVDLSGQVDPVRVAPCFSKHFRA